MRERRITLLLDEQHAIDGKIEKLTAKRGRVKAKLDALRARCNHDWRTFRDGTGKGCERCGLEQKNGPKPSTVMMEVAGQINEAREVVESLKPMEGVESIRDASKRLMDSTEPVVEAKPQN